MGENRTVPTWRELAAGVEQIANGAKEHQLGDLYLSMLIAGLVTSEEIMKPCRTCGTPRLDHRYVRITEAGRLLMAAAKDPRHD